MRGRSGHLVITPSPAESVFTERISVTDSVFTERLKRLSLDESSLEAKENLGVKLEKYRILLEKEYELRSRLTQSHKLDDRNVSCYDCGKKLDALLVPPRVKIERSQSDNLRAIQDINGRKSRHPIRRQLSVDDIKTSNAAILRKMAAKEKAEKRRTSMQSLEADVAKARSLMRRSRSLDAYAGTDTDTDEAGSNKGNLFTVDEYDQIHSDELQDKIDNTLPKSVPIFYI